jgi:dipeptidyl aminopeptidase/acylaminoacyl peptidase
VNFDAVVRDLAAGTEQVIEVGDGSIDEAVLSPDGRFMALTAPSVTAANSEQVLLTRLAPGGSAAAAESAASPGASPGSLSAASPGSLSAAPPAAQPSGRWPAGLIEVTAGGALEMNRNLHWLPDSDAVILTSNHGREFTAVARYDLADGGWTWLVTDDSRDVSGWPSPDGRLLLVERNTDGASALSVHETATGRHLRDLPLPGPGAVTGGWLPVPRWSPGSGTAALTVSGDQLPGDVLLADAEAGSVRPLTHSDRGLGGEQAARAQLHRVPTPDGEQVPCLVYRSADPADPGLASSAVVVVHGGPESQALQTFNSYVQVLAAAGHTVLVPNVRGSTGYGKRWYSADDVGRRLEAVADLAALHSYLPKLGVDPARAALWGASYGGYMVLAGLAFQPALWAAGVDIVGISSFITFLENTSAYRRAYREREYGTLARDQEILRAASPLTRIDEIRAALFIIHGANDPRVPLTEAEQIHAALTGRGQECELTVYPDEGHGLARRANRLDAVPKALAFLARHLAA